MEPSQHTKTPPTGEPPPTSALSVSAAIQQDTSCSRKDGSGNRCQNSAYTATHSARHGHHNQPQTESENTSASARTASSNEFQGCRVFYSQYEHISFPHHPLCGTGKDGVQSPSQERSTGGQTGMLVHGARFKHRDTHQPQ